MTDQLSEFDQLSNSFKLNIGGNIKSGKAWKTSFSYNNIQLNNKSYLDYAGVNSSMTFRSGSIKRTFGYLHQQKRYAKKNNASSNTSINQIGFTQSFQSSPYYIVGRVAYREKEVRLDKSTSLSRFTFDTRIQRKIKNGAASSLWKYAIYSRISIAAYEYAETDADLAILYGSEYDKARKEKRYNLTLGINSKLNNVQIKGSALLQYRDSNLPIYNYSKNILEVEFQYRF